MTTASEAALDKKVEAILVSAHEQWLQQLSEKQRRSKLRDTAPCRVNARRSQHALHAMQDPRAWEELPLSFKVYTYEVLTYIWDVVAKVKFLDMVGR